MRKVVYTTSRRPTVEAKGLTQVSLVESGKDGETTTALGTIQRAFRTKDFEAFRIDGAALGVFGTRSQAGEALKKDLLGNVRSLPAGKVTSTSADDADEGEGTPKEADLGDMLSGRMVSKEDAIAELGISKDALRKRIKRGTVKTTTVDGEEFVVLD